ncbi:MAG: GNAT family N-acetyltransferase [Promethearchaeota archaeon]
MSNLEYKVIDVNESNLDKYGLFCHASKKKSPGYKNKEIWIKERFKEGLKLKLLLVKENGKFRSKGFIEYIPGEYAWRGIEAKGYMIIHCLWVKGLKGKYKGSGLDSILLEQCLKDAENMYGVAVVTEKTTWLPLPQLFRKHGFEKVDTFPPSFNLYVKRFSDTDPFPKFNSDMEDRRKEYFSGFTVFYSYQCPETLRMVEQIERFAKQEAIPVQKILIENYKDAQNGIHPYGTSCYLLEGKVLSYHPDHISRLITRLKSKD